MASKGDGYWGKGDGAAGGGADGKDPNGEFWAKAQVSKREAEQLVNNPGQAVERKRERRRRRRNIVLGVVGALVLVAGAAVAFAPQIASGLAPGLVKSKSGEILTGSATVQSVSLSWSGPQRIEGLTLFHEGKPVAVVSLNTSAGLLGLARGNLDLGDIVITEAQADIVRNKDGSTNLQKALEPRKPASGSSGSASKPDAAKLPEGLKAKVRIDALSVSFTDLSQPALASGVATGVTLRKLRGDIEVETGAPLEVKLTGDAYEGAFPTGKSPTGTPGTIAVDVRLSDWSATTGEITTRNAKAKASIELKGLPVALADAFAPLKASGPGVVPPSFAKALGSRIDLTVKANGSPSNMTGTLTAAAQNLSANADVTWKDGFLVATTPLTASVKGAALSELVPAIGTALAAQSQATIDALPDVSITVRQFRMPFANDGKPLDLRGTSADLSVAITQMTGSVALRPGEAAQPFVLAPLDLKVTSTDLASGLAATARTDLTVGNQRAGEIALDVTSGGILDRAGAPLTGLPPDLRGSASIKGMATAIAQPFVQASGLDLATDIGPTLDLVVTATSETAASNSATPSGVTAPTALTLQLSSQNVTASGGVRVESTGIRTGSEGLTIQVGSVGNLVSRFVKPETGWSLAASGPSQATVSIPQFSITKDATGAFVTSSANLKADVTVRGLSARSLAAPAEPPIEIASFTLNTVLNEGDALIKLDSAMSHAGSPFSATADMRIADVLASSPKPGESPVAPIETLRPEGFVQITGLPMMMVNVFAPPSPVAVGHADQDPVQGADRFTFDSPVDAFLAAQPGGQLPNPPAGSAPVPQPATAQPAVGQPAVAGAVVAAKPLNLGKLLTSTLGPTLDARLQSKPGVKTGQIDLAVTAKAERLDVSSGASVTSREVALAQTRATARVTPETVQGLLREFAPDVKGMPRLVAPGTIELAVEPLLIPLDEKSKPIMSQIGIAKVALTSPQPILVEGLTMAGADGQPRDIGRIGIEGLSISAEAPVAAFVSAVGLSDRKVRAAIAAAVVGASNAPLVRLSGELDAEVSDGKLAGGSVANVKLDKVDTASIDRMLGKDGMLSGTLGRTADASLVARMSPPAGKGPADFTAADFDITATLNAPNVETTGPVKVSITPARIRLNEPARFIVRVDPALANPFLNPPPQPGQPARSPAATLTMTQPATVTMSLDKLVMPRKGGRDTFEAGTSLTIPMLAFATGDGHTIGIESTEFRAITDSSQPNPPLTFRLESRKVTVDGKPANEPVLFQGQIDNLVDKTGAVSTETATLSAGGRFGGVPTALIDALARKQGMLVDALGEFVTATVEARQVALKGFGTPGSASSAVSITVESPRAKASVRGNLDSTVFASSEPVTVSVDEIVSAFTERYLGSVPVLEKLEKVRGQRPASVRAEGLTVPLDNDMRKLNGDIQLDPGELNFKLSGSLNELLGENNKYKQEGFLGQRLKPVSMNIREGVATVQRYALPIGEFTLEAEGSVDLVREQVDIVTWIPATLLADEILVGIVGKIGVPVTALSNVQKITTSIRTYVPLIPYRTRGPLKSPKPSLVPDFDLIRQEFQRNGGIQKILQDSLGDQVKDLIGDQIKDRLKIPGLGDLPIPAPK